MNGYFSNFISRFGGTDLLNTAAYSNAADSAKVAEINYLTLYNATWADESDESLHNLSKQILFFISPGLDDEINLTQDELDRRSGEQLNVVGLLRGSCSIASEFGKHPLPVRVKVSGAAIIVVEIEKSFLLACSVALPSNCAERHDAIQAQVEQLMDTAHRAFKVLHPPFEKLLEIHGKKEFARILREYWLEFLVNFNDASRLPFGPRLLGWPTRMNHQGLFRFLPSGSYRKLTVKVPDSLATDLDDLVRQSHPVPSGYFVANYSRAMPKKYGLIYSKSDWNGDTIDPDALLDVYNLLEFLDYHGELVTDRVGRRNPFSNLFTQLDTQSVHLSDDEDSEQLALTAFSLNPAAAIELLHPVNITNNLVINPLTSTVSGLRTLGLAVNDQLPAPPAWFGLGRFANAETQPEETAVEPHDDESHEESGMFITGANGDSSITQMLVHLPTRSGEAIEVREYLLVLYLSEEVLQGFLFESGLEQLGQKAFYEELKWDVCEQTMAVIQECFLISSGGIGLNTSISSLPNPLKSIISGKPAEMAAHYDDVDLDFFFIIYDTKDRYYQSSLPNLPLLVPSVAAELPKLAHSFNNAIFHLHDQLVDHFVVKSAGSVFTKTSVVEHLHKFSSNKHNNWLFYSIRHKNKAIIIIRNYNTKHKKTARPVSSEPAEGSLTNAENLTASAPEYSSLGFLDTLGQDVKVWLDKLNYSDTS